MIVLILTVVLVLGIAFLQMKQGLFSALVMAVLSVCSAALALSIYKPLAGATGLYDRVGPQLAQAGILAVVFFLAIFTLRTVAEKLITQDIYFSTIIDRLGGAICGIITGMTMTGILLVVAQLLPLPATILDYKPYDENLRRSQRLAPFYPDDFVQALGGFVTRGWAGQARGDILRDAFCGRNTAGLTRRGRVDKDALVSAEAHELKNPKFAKAPNNLNIPDAMTKLLAIRVEVSQAGAIDQDDWWRLPGTQFALRCDDGKNYYPVGYLFYSLARRGWQLADVPAEKLAVQRPLEDAPPKLGLVVDWVYRIPIKATPTTLSFGQQAWVRVNMTGKAFPLGDIKTRLTALKGKIGK
jgi:uncharacterized membrane protein required for colicin V production